MFGFLWENPVAKLGKDLWVQACVSPTSALGSPLHPHGSDWTHGGVSAMARNPEQLGKAILYMFQRH